MASPRRLAAEPAAISKAGAENVVANYSQVNNKANAAHSDSLLATIEGGSSYITTADGKTLSKAYLVFTQNAVGAPWKDVIEPDILSGQTLPQIAVDSSGYAQSVAPDPSGLNVAPDKIGQVTAEWLDQVAAGRWCN